VSLLTFLIESTNKGQGQGARGKGQGARGKGQGARGKGQGARGTGQGARGKGQGARGKGQGARGKGQGARGKGQGARGKGRGSCTGWRGRLKLGHCCAETASLASFAAKIFTSEKLKIGALQGFDGVELLLLQDLYHAVAQRNAGTPFGKFKP
jgi:hypothetical protein